MRRSVRAVVASFEDFFLKSGFRTVLLRRGYPSLTGGCGPAALLKPLTAYDDKRFVDELLLRSRQAALPGSHEDFVRHQYELALILGVQWRAVILADDPAYWPLELRMCGREYRRLLGARPGPTVFRPIISDLDRDGRLEETPLFLDDRKGAVDVLRRLGGGDPSVYFDLHEQRSEIVKDEQGVEYLVHFAARPKYPMSALRKLEETQRLLDARGVLFTVIACRHPGRTFETATKDDALSFQTLLKRRMWQGAEFEIVPVSRPVSQKRDPSYWDAKFYGRRTLRGVGPVLGLLEVMTSTQDIRLRVGYERIGINHALRRVDQVLSTTYANYFPSTFAPDLSDGMVQERRIAQAAVLARL